MSDNWIPIVFCAAVATIAGLIANAIVIYHLVDKLASCH